MFLPTTIGPYHFPWHGIFSDSSTTTYRNDLFLTVRLLYFRHRYKEHHRSPMTSSKFSSISRGRRDRAFRKVAFINVGFLLSIFFLISLFSPRALEPSIDRELISMLLRIVFSTAERSSCGRRAPPQFFRPPRRTADIVVHISARGVSTIFLFSVTVTYVLCPLPIA